MVALGSMHSRYLEGFFLAGESYRALLGLVLAVGLGPDPGFPSAFYTGALIFGSCRNGHSRSRGLPRQMQIETQGRDLVLR